MQCMPCDAMQCDVMKRLARTYQMCIVALRALRTVLQLRFLDDCLFMVVGRWLLLDWLVLGWVMVDRW